MAEPKVRFKRDDGSSYPDLVDKKLGDIGSVLMCKRVFREQTDSTGDVPFYKIGTFGGVPDAFISRELYEELKSKYSFPKKGNVLLSAAGTIGRTVRYDGKDRDAHAFRYAVSSEIAAITTGLYGSNCSRIVGFAGSLSMSAAGAFAPVSAAFTGSADTSSSFAITGIE